MSSITTNCFENKIQKSSYLNQIITNFLILFVMIAVSLIFLVGNDFDFEDEITIVMFCIFIPSALGFLAYFVKLIMSIRTKIC